MAGRTLGDIDVVAREPVEGSERGLHVDFVRVEDGAESFELGLDVILLVNERKDGFPGCWGGIVGGSGGLRDAGVVDIHGGGVGGDGGVDASIAGA